MLIYLNLLEISGSSGSALGYLDAWISIKDPDLVFY